MPLVIGWRRWRVIMAVVAALTAVGYGTSEAVAHHEVLDRADADLAALFLFNGEDGERFYDHIGPLGDPDNVWRREGEGIFGFTAARAGTRVDGRKSVTVEPSCRVSVSTQIIWRYDGGAVETFEKNETLRLSGQLNADQLVVPNSSEDGATVIVIAGDRDTHCEEVAVNGVARKPWACSSSFGFMAGPGRRAPLLISALRTFIDRCGGRP